MVNSSTDTRQGSWGRFTLKDRPKFQLTCNVLECPPWQTSTSIALISHSIWQAFLGFYLYLPGYWSWLPRVVSKFFSLGLYVNVIIRIFSSLENTMCTSVFIRCPPCQLGEEHQKSSLRVVGEAVRAFVELLVGAGKLLIKLLEKLVTVVIQVLKSPLLRRLLLILGQGFIIFLTTILLNLFANDISQLLQNHGQILMGTAKSRIIYAVLAGIVLPYWLLRDYFKSTHPKLPEPSVQQSTSIEAELAPRILEWLQSRSGANLDLGERTPTPTPSNCPERFYCIVTVGASISIEHLHKIGADLVLPGSKVLYKCVEVNPQKPEELDNCISQIVDSMRLAHDVDEHCFLQLGSYAVFKYTDAGPKMWILQEDWTPRIIDIRRHWRSFDFLFGRPAKWIIRGFNLQGATLRAANIYASEDLEGFVKHERGVDTYICEEPHIIQNSTPTFKEKVFISASNLKEVGEGVSLKLQSEAKDVQRPYWISVAHGFIYAVGGAIAIIVMGKLSSANYNLFGRKFLFSKLLPNLQGGDMDTIISLSYPWRYIWSHVSSDFQISYFLVLVNLCTLPLIIMFKILPRAHHVRPRRMLLSRSSEGTSEASPGIDSPRAVSPPSDITKLNDSVWELHSPRGIPALEIIFFPGLQPGDFRNSFWKTWLAMGDEHVVWPKEWLGSEFPNARILCVSYDSYATRIVGQPDKINIGECLVHDIMQDKNLNIGRNCPVFLVGHSLGGIVIKQFVLSAFKKVDLFNQGKSQEYMHTISRKVDLFNQGISQEDMRTICRFLGNWEGTFFYAAPNGSSRIAELASQIPSASPILELLRKIDTASGRINEEFRKHGLKGRINKEFRQHGVKRVPPSFALAEGCPTHYGAFHGTVVEMESARRDVCHLYVHLRANHFTACARFVQDKCL